MIFIEGVCFSAYITFKISTGTRKHRDCLYGNGFNFFLKHKRIGLITDLQFSHKRLSSSARDE
jgi:hypothetical protein